MKSAFLILGREGTAVLPDGTTKLIGVKSFEEAEEKVLEFKNDGTQFVELCGAFGPERTKKYIEMTDHKIPFGYIVRFPEIEPLFRKAFDGTGRKCKFAFMIMGKGRYGRAFLPDGVTSIVGVDNFDIALEKAKELVEEGVECIECCGAFKEPDIRRLFKETGEKIAICMMEHIDDPETNEVRRKLFANE